MPLLLSGSSYSPTNAKRSFSAQDGGLSCSMNLTAVPVLAAVWLFGSGLIGLVAVARRNVDLLVKHASHI